MVKQGIKENRGIDLRNKNRYLTFKIIFIFTAIFAIVFGIILFLYFLNDKFPITGGDHREQYYTSFFNIVDSLKTEGLGIFAGGGFNWNIGIGDSWIIKFSHYNLYDPSFVVGVVLAATFPKFFIDLFFLFTLLFKVYLAGITFIFLARYFGTNVISCVLGACVYTFSTFSLYFFLVLPTFIVPMIYFPLLILAIEKLFNEGKVLFLSVVVCLASIGSFYNFPQMIGLTFIYALIKLFLERKNLKLKGSLILFLKGFSGVFLGVSLSAIILFPIIYSYLFLGRDSVLVDNIPRYVNLIKIFDAYHFAAGRSISRWGMLGITLITIPLLIYNFKKFKELAIFQALLMIILIVPALYYVVNMGDTSTGRWEYALTLIPALSVSLFFAGKSNIAKKGEIIELKSFKYEQNEIKIIGIIVSLQFAFTVFFTQGFISKNTLLNYAFAVIFLIVIIFQDKIKKILNPFYLQISILFVLVIYTTISIPTIKAGVNKGDDPNRQLGFNIYENSKPFNSVKKLVNNVKEKDKGIYRISNLIERRGDAADFLVSVWHNLSLLLDFNATEGYLSLYSNKHSNVLGRKIADPSNVHFVNVRSIHDLAVKTLLGGKYFLSNEKINSKQAKLVSKNGIYYMYENKSDIGILPFYDSYLLEKNNNPATITRDLLLKTSVISKNPTINIKKNSMATNVDEKSYDVLEGKKEVQNKKFNVSLDEKYKDIIVDLKKINTNKNLYLEIEGLKYTPPALNKRYEYEMVSGKGIGSYPWEKIPYIQRNKGWQNQILIRKENNVVIDRDVLKNKYEWGYFEKPYLKFDLSSLKQNENEIKIHFSNPGSYSFKSIRVFEEDKDFVITDAKKLNETRFKIEKFENGLVEGSINAKKAGILQLTTLYNDGWKVYVDGKEKEVITSNYAFVGVELPKGKHKVSFKYSRPYGKLGMIVSIIAWLIFISCIVLNILRKKNIIKKKIDIKVQEKE